MSPKFSLWCYPCLCHIATSNSAQRDIKVFSINTSLCVEGSICISFVCRLHLHLAPWVWDCYIFRLRAGCFYSFKKCMLWTGRLKSLLVHVVHAENPSMLAFRFISQTLVWILFIYVLKVSRTLRSQLEFFMFTTSIKKDWCQRVQERI